MGIHPKLRSTVKDDKSHTPSIEILQRMMSFIRSFLREIAVELMDANKKHDRHFKTRTTV